MSDAVPTPGSLHTVSGLLTWAAGVLAKAEVESPRMTAEILLGYVLGWDRVRVIAHVQRPIPGRRAEEFQDLILQRAAGRPLQYLIGRQEFFGRVFEVDPSVLIPRPETELLVEKAVQLARSRADRRTIRFVDVGTGSGCIALTFALEIPSSSGCAVDLAEQGLRLASRNAAALGAEERVRFLLGDLLEAFPSRPLFDFVFSNPPYVSSGDRDSLPAQVRDYEPHRALFSGPTGIEVYQRLLPQVKPRLKPGGYLLLEIGFGQADAVSRLVADADLTLVGILPDLQEIPRCLVATSGRQHN